MLWMYNFLQATFRKGYYRVLLKNSQAVFQWTTLENFRKARGVKISLCTNKSSRNYNVANISDTAINPSVEHRLPNKQLHRHRYMHFQCNISE